MISIHRTFVFPALGLVFSFQAGAGELESLNVLQALHFGSDNGQVASFLNCDIADFKKKMQHCRLVSTVYTESTIQMETVREAQDRYLRRSPVEARTIAVRYCEEIDRSKKILVQSDLLPGRRQDLESGVRQMQPSCDCRLSEMPNQCLAATVVDQPRRKTICEVSSVATNFVMVRQDDGTWAGSGRDTFCGGDSHIAIRPFKGVSGQADFVMDWTSSKQGRAPLPLCEVLNRVTQLRTSAPSVSIKMACNEIRHMPIQ